MSQVHHKTQFVYVSHMMIVEISLILLCMCYKACIRRKRRIRPLKTSLQEYISRMVCLFPGAFFTKMTMPLILQFGSQQSNFLIPILSLWLQSILEPSCVFYHSYKKLLGIGSLTLDRTSFMGSIFLFP